MGATSSASASVRLPGGLSSFVSLHRELEGDCRRLWHSGSRLRFGSLWGATSAGVRQAGEPAVQRQSLRM